MRRASIALAAAFAASCANAELPGSSAAQATAAAADCAEASKDGTVAIDELEARGWQAASMQSNGREIESPLKLFGKLSGGPVLMVSPASSNSPQGCLITGRLEKLSDFEALEAAFRQEFEAAGRKGEDRFFRIAADTVVLTPTGSRDKPAFRIAVLELGVSE